MTSVTGFRVPCHSFPDTAGISPSAHWQMPKAVIHDPVGHEMRAGRGHEVRAANWAAGDQHTGGVRVFQGFGLKPGEALIVRSSQSENIS